MIDEMIAQRLASVDQMEQKVPTFQPTHYDSSGGALSEISMNNPRDARPEASRVLLTQGKFTASIFLPV